MLAALVSCAVIFTLVTSIALFMYLRSRQRRPLQRNAAPPASPQPHHRRDQHEEENTPAGSLNMAFEGESENNNALGRLQWNQPPPAYDSIVELSERGDRNETPVDGISLIMQRLRVETSCSAGGGDRRGEERFVPPPSYEQSIHHQIHP